MIKITDNKGKDQLVVKEDGNIKIYAAIVTK